MMSDLCPALFVLVCVIAQLFRTVIVTVWKYEESPETRVKFLVCADTINQIRIQISSKSVLTKLEVQMCVYVCVCVYNGISRCQLNSLLWRFWDFGPDHIDKFSPPPLSPSPPAPTLSRGVEKPHPGSLVKKQTSRFCYRARKVDTLLGYTTTQHLRDQRWQKINVCRYLKSIN